jgi:hypothetical protein
MQRRLTHVLIAFLVAAIATLPVSVRAMPMPAGMTGTTFQQPCPNCPHVARDGADSGKMPGCHGLACACPAATLPSPARLPARALLRAAYLLVSPVRWEAAARAPDPYPPRAIALA